MATITAAPGGGAWTVGGTWVGGSAPTAADDALLTGTSGSVTVDTGAVARSLNCTGYTGTLTHTAAVTLTLGDPTAGVGNVALTLVSGMTYTLGNATTSAISFVSTSATQQTVAWGTRVPGNVTFGTAGNYLFSDGYTAAATTLTHTAGTLNINGQTLSLSVFAGTGATLRTLTMGAANITCALAGTSWSFAVTTNLTITANTATATLTGAGATFAGGGINYNGTSVVINGSGTSSISGSNTFANLTRTGTTAKTDGLSLASSTQTISSTLTINSNSTINRLLISSSTVGTARSLTAATVVISNIVDFMDITGAGAATWTVAGTGASALGDAGGNSGITFTTPATQTWSGTTSANWSANAWTTRVPLPQDNVIINAAFSASQTVTIDMPRLGTSISFVGATGTPAFAFGISTIIFGSMTLISGMTISGSGNLTLGGRSTFTLTSAGKSYGGQVLVVAPSGTYTLADDLTTTQNLTVSNGTLDGGGFNVTCLTLQSSASTTRGLTLGSGTWSLTSTAATTVWNIATSGLTFSGSSGAIAITTTSANTRTFAGAGLTFGILTYTVAGSTGTLVITGANTFTTINFSDSVNARILQFTAATTTTITGSFNVFGTVGLLMSVQSATAATHTLSKPSGIVNGVNYVNLTNSIATGGATWYAGANSTDSGGNTGWIFTAAPFVPAAGGISSSAGLQSHQSLQNLINLQ